MGFSVAAVLCLASVGHAWVPSVIQAPANRPSALLAPPGRLAPSTKTATFTLYMTENVEEQLRDQLAEKNAGAVALSERYALVDGSGLEMVNKLEGPEDTTYAPANTEEQRKALLEKQIERMTRPRWYPLFVLEKATEIVESLLEEVMAALQKTGLGIGQEALPKKSTIPKERIVVLGTGWGGASFLKEIDTDRFDVTVISPRNFFLFTPMLAGASVGTVEYRSICEPVREINRHARYLEATAQYVDPLRRTIECESVICEGNSCDIESFTVEYDRLIVTVGAQTNTFGIPGVKERCNFLKSVQDARRIKGAIVNCFERANLPHLSDEQRVHGLTFAVIGAGPTGIEFAAELRDFIEQDGPKYFPSLLKFVRIKVIEASPVILAPFDKSLQEEAIRQMQRKVRIADTAVYDLLPERFELTELLLESSVKEVGEDTIYLNNGREIPYGLAVWAAGNGPIPLTLQIIESMGKEQAVQQDVARGRLAVDPWMRVIGGEGRVLAFGDCTCITAGQLPATAQVASQQGEHLAKQFNKGFDFSPERSPEGLFPPPVKVPEQTEPSFSDAIAAFAMNNNEFAKPFQFLNLGILAYTGGGSALAQVTPAPDAPAVKAGGKLGNAVWRSVYLSKQVSWRNRLLVLNDWTNRQIFGRDITRL